MKINNELKVTIKELFERPDYYGRSLSDAEVQDIADNLVSYGELLVEYAKANCENTF